MKSRFFLFAVWIIATATAAERWWSPDKFYSIVWRIKTKQALPTAAGRHVYHAKARSKIR